MRIIYFLSLLFVFNLSVGQKSKPILVEAKYAVNSNNTWSFKEAKSKKFIPFSKNNSLNIGYNKQSAVWCYFKIKNNDSKNDRKTWLCFDNNHIDSLVFYNPNKEKVYIRLRNQVRY